VLHGVVDGEAGDDRAAGAVDVQVDRLVGVLVIQILCKRCIAKENDEREWLIATRVERKNALTSSTPMI
jgi:hypothetical protein